MDITDEQIAQALADIATSQQALAARLQARKHTLQREREEEANDIADLQRLRLLAVRLSAEAGVPYVTEKTFFSRTKNQLLNTIQELRHFMNTKEA